MPDSKNRRNPDFDKYDHMSTKELQEFLRLDAKNPEGNESDDDSILYIMGVLADRDHDENEKTAEEAYLSFQKNYYPLRTSLEDLKDAPAEKVHIRKKQNNLLRRSCIAAAMVALILITSLSVNAVRGDFWADLAKWTQKIFHIGAEHQISMEEPYSDDSDAFQSLRETLEKRKIPTDMIPTWIPEEYVFEKIDIIESPQSTMVNALYKSNYDKVIAIQIKDYKEKNVQQIEKGDDFFEIYHTNDNKVYIFNNTSRYSACWINGNIEYWIQSDVTLEELHQILDSVKGV